MAPHPLEGGEPFFFLLRFLHNHQPTLERQNAVGKQI
jgi:hypothetical protein